MMAEAELDLLRLVVEKDQCSQESAAVAAAYALRLVRAARLSYA